MKTCLKKYRTGRPKLFLFPYPLFCSTKQNESRVIIASVKPFLERKT